MEVGDGLLSCSREVQRSKPFDLNGRKVVMIDTPGFDDSTRSDTEILKTIATYLAETWVFKAAFRISNITDTKTGIVPTEN